MPNLRVRLTTPHISFIPDQLSIVTIAEADEKQRTSANRLTVHTKCAIGTGERKEKTKIRDN